VRFRLPTAAPRERFDWFHHFLLKLCGDNKETPGTLLFNDYCEIVSQWLIRDTDARSAS
jgi:hypothetical protein